MPILYIIAYIAYIAYYRRTKFGNDEGRSVDLDPTPESRKQKHVYGISAERVPPLRTKTVVNGLAMAHHGLILCQDGATPHIDLLEALFLFFPYMFGDILAKMLDF